MKGLLSELKLEANIQVIPIVEDFIIIINVNHI